MAAVALLLAKAMDGALATGHVQGGYVTFAHHTDPAIPAIPATYPTIAAITRISDMVILGGAIGAIMDTP